jgi:hypothetical protein
MGWVVDRNMSRGPDPSFFETFFTSGVIGLRTFGNGSDSSFDVVCRTNVGIVCSFAFFGFLRIFDFS